MPSGRRRRDGEDLVPWETSFQAPSLKLPFTSSAPYGAEVDQRVLDREAAQPVRLQHDHIGQALLAEIAVWTLVYSSPP